MSKICLVGLLCTPLKCAFTAVVFRIYLSCDLCEHASANLHNTRVQQIVLLGEVLVKFSCLSLLRHLLVVLFSSQHSFYFIWNMQYRQCTISKRGSLSNKQICYKTIIICSISTANRQHKTNIVNVAALFICCASTFYVDIVTIHFNTSQLCSLVG